MLTKKKIKKKRFVQHPIGIGLNALNKGDNRIPIHDNRYNENAAGQQKVEDDLINIAGATSSELNFDFHDLPYAGLLAAARRFHLGHYKHGRFNWTKGNAQFAEERLKHLMAHASKYATYRNSEDLDALICNAMMLADFDYRGILSHEPRYNFMLEGKREQVTITVQQGMTTRKDK